MYPVRDCVSCRRTKRFEAHIWDQRQQRYLGGFDREIDAGRAHDVMAIKCRADKETPILNFPMDSYAELVPFIDALNKVPSPPFSPLPFHPAYPALLPAVHKHLNVHQDRLHLHHQDAKATLQLKSPIKFVERAVGRICVIDGVLRC